MKSKYEWDQYFKEKGSPYRVYHKIIIKACIFLGCISILALLTISSLFVYVFYIKDFSVSVSTPIDNNVNNEYQLNPETNNEFSNEFRHTFNFDFDIDDELINKYCNCS